MCGKYFGSPWCCIATRYFRHRFHLDRWTSKEGRLHAGSIGNDRHNKLESSTKGLHSRQDNAGFNYWTLLISRLGTAMWNSEVFKHIISIPHITTSPSVPLRLLSGSLTFQVKSSKRVCLWILWERISKFSYRLTLRLCMNRDSTMIQPPRRIRCFMQSPSLSVTDLRDGWVCLLSESSLFPNESRGKCLRHLLPL